MPFDGTGNYSPPSPPTFPAVNGEVIRSDYFNAIINDIATAMSLAFTKDGQSAPTAELDFNNQNLTNIDALDATSVDALNYFINGDLLDYTAFSQDFISAADAAEARAKLGLSAGTDSGLISGGQVFWESGYTFRVSAATYIINGVYYSSAEQTVTLASADPTNDRIDVIYLDSAGLAGDITGTAAALPTEPDIEFATQIKLTFVFVEAASSAPGTVTNTNIYLENTEWTSSTSGSGFNAASTNNPYSGTTCIEGTAVANNAYVSLQAGAPFTLDGVANLSMFIRSKATWASGRVLRVQWYLNGVAKGIPLTIASGYWGFNSTTLAYQLVAIPMAQFVLPTGTSVNQLRITNSGGSIGFYIDNIVLQSQGTDLNQGGEDYLTQGEGDARYVPLTYLDTDTTLAANSDSRVATQKAVKAYVDAIAFRTPSFQIVGTTPSANEVLLAWTPASGETVTFADDFSGSTAKAATTSTNPASTYSMPVLKNGSTVGSISISSGGSVTFATTGTTVEIIGGTDVLEVLGNATPDTAVGFTFTLKGSL